MRKKMLLFKHEHKQHLKFAVQSILIRRCSWIRILRSLVAWEEGTLTRRPSPPQMVLTSQVQWGEHHGEFGLHHNLGQVSLYIQGVVQIL